MARELEHHVAQCDGISIQPAEAAAAASAAAVATALLSFNEWMDGKISVRFSFQMIGSGGKRSMCICRKIYNFYIEHGLSTVVLIFKKCIIIEWKETQIQKCSSCDRCDWKQRSGVGCNVVAKKINSHWFCASRRRCTHFSPCRSFIFLIQIYFVFPSRSLICPLVEFDDFWVSAGVDTNATNGINQRWCWW